MLQKELNASSVEQQNEENFQEIINGQHHNYEILVTKGMNQFALLRSIWGKQSSIKNADQKIAELNLKTVRIKKHIKQIIKKQNNIQCTQLHKYVIQSVEFRQLKQKYDSLFEEHKTLKKKNQSVQKKFINLQKCVSDLIKRNIQLSRNLDQIADKLKKKQQQHIKLLHKIQNLELENFKKQTQLKKSIKQIKNYSQYEGKKMKFTGNDFTITMQSYSLELQGSYSTGKTTNQIKAFLVQFNQLEGLIQGKFTQSIPHLRSLALINNIQSEATTKRRSAFDNLSPRRHQNLLGSQQKRRRFQRCKIQAQQ